MKELLAGWKVIIYWFCYCKTAWVLNWSAPCVNGEVAATGALLKEVEAAWKGFE